MPTFAGYAFVRAAAGPGDSDLPGCSQTAIEYTLFALRLRTLPVTYATALLQRLDRDVPLARWTCERKLGHGSGSILTVVGTESLREEVRTHPYDWSAPVLVRRA